MIQVKKIVPPTVDIYDPNDTFLGTVNEYEFLELRVQIKKAQVSGYYFKTNGKKVRIDKNGTLEEYPIGVLDTMSGFYCELIPETPENLL